MSTSRCAQFMLDEWQKVPMMPTHELFRVAWHNIKAQATSVFSGATVAEALRDPQVKEIQRAFG